MKKLSKVLLTSVSLAIFISSCSSNADLTTADLLPAENNSVINQQEISSFASQTAGIMTIEQDVNKDDKISKAEAGITSNQMLALDKNRDGSITKDEIASSIQEQFNQAAVVSDALGRGTTLSQQYDGDLPNKPLPSTFKPNKIQLYIDRDEIVPMMMSAIQGAQKSIQMDLYLLGGKIGLQIAQELVKKAKQGVDVKLNFDPNLGFSGPTQQEIYTVIDYLRANKMDFRLYPLHLMPKVVDSALTNKFQIDHNKMTVIDGSTLITGGFNLFDLGVGNRDLMYKIEGPTAKEASDLLTYEWLLSDKFVDKKPPKEVFVVKADPGADAMAKITKTAPFESTTKPAMIEMIDNAKQSVYLAVLEFSDVEITNALIRAFKRGVDVKVMMDRKDTNDKYAGGLPVPSYFPNILPARDLVKNHVPTRWYDARYDGQELHMKMIVVDGNKMLAGSTNFTRQAFTTFRETSVVVDGGSAPPKMVRTFMEDWLNHSTAIKTITLSDKIKAKVVEYLDKKYYSWW